MNKWMILGISATEDKEAIKRAYMAELPKYNPEEDPDGFVRLRTAYEDVLKEIDEKAKKENEEQTPLDVFMEKVKELYNDFKRRRDGNEWVELLKEDVCTRLDLADLTEDAILVFFMDNYYLPIEAWQAMDKHFDWSSKADILKQNFPPAFIDFVLDNVKQESINYKLFTTDENSIEEADTHHYDRFIWLYYEVEAHINAGNLESDSFKAAKEEIEALPVKHVYYDLQVARMYINDEPNKSLEIVTPLYEKMPEDAPISHVYGMALLNVGRADEALAHFKALHEKNENDSWAKRGSIKGVIDAMIKLEDYEEARTLLLDLLAEFPYDAYAQSAIWTVTTELVKIYEKKYEETPNDLEVALTLAKHYLNCDQMENSLTVLEKLPQTTDDPRYFEYMAVALDRLSNFEKSGQYFEKLIAKEQKYRYYVDYSAMLMASGKNDEAISIIDKGLATDMIEEDNVSQARLYGNKGLALYNLQKYDEALVAFDEGLALNDQMANLHVYKARIYQDTGRYGEAIESCEKALYIFPYLTDAYTIQMEVYNNSGMFEQMLDIAAWAERSGWDSPRVKYHKAGALRMLGDFEQASEIIDVLLEAEFDEGYRDFFHVEAGHLAEAKGDFDTALFHMNKALEIAPDFIYRKVLLANTHRLRGAFKDAINICNRLLDEQPDFLYALLTRGDVYFDQRKYDRARDDFETMLKIHPENDQAIDRIVSTYVDERRYDKAIEWTLRRLEIYESINSYLDLAYLYDCNGQQEEAEATYKKLLDRFPETGIGNRFYGFYLSRRERHEDAIAQYVISLEKEPEQADLYEEWAYSLRVLKRYEEGLEILDKGAEMAAGNRGAILMQRGLILERMCRYDDSLNCMLEASELPDEIQGWTMAGVYNEIGITYRGNKNDPENALKYFKKALEFDENFADANENMGYMNLYYFKNYAEALKYYDRAIMLRPDEPRVYLERAKARLKSGKLFSGGAAKKDYKTALQLYEMRSKEDTSPCNQIYITVCKIGLGEEQMAKEFLEKMIDTPQNPEAWCARPKCDCCLYWLGQIYEKEKNYEEALKYYEEAVKVSDSIKHNLAVAEVKAQM